MNQGSDDWLAWRQKGIGSSDAPVLMGCYDFKTPFQLYEEKTNPLSEKEKGTNWAMQRGHDLEPLARAQYELLCDIEMLPALLVHPKYQYIRASLDGYNAEANRVLEIKCPGAKDHQTALKEKRVPEKYYAQLQHQLLVTGAERVDYYSFDGTSGVLIEVYPDQDFIAQLLLRERYFWEQNVEKGTPPALTDRDYVVETDFVNLANMAEWKHKQRQIKTLEKDCEELKAHLLTRLKHPRVRGNGVRIQKIFRKGNVDYSAVPQLEGIDLEGFRKPGTEYYSFGIEKGPE